MNNNALGMVAVMMFLIIASIGFMMREKEKPKEVKTNIYSGMLLGNSYHITKTDEFFEIVRINPDLQGK